MPTDQAIGLHLSQLLREDFFADAGQQSPQFGEAMRSYMQGPQQRRLPLPADCLQRRCKPAIIRFLALIVLGS